MLKRLFLFLMVFAVPALAFSPVEELSRDLLNLEAGALCAAYRAPLDPEGQPQGIFVEAPALADKRREQSELFRTALAPYLGPLTGARASRFTELGNRVLSQVHDSLGAGRALPAVFELDEERLCVDRARSRVEAEAPNAPAAAKEAMHAAIQAECLEESYGRANFAANEIILGRAVAHHRNAVGAEFAYLHELCHILYPAIRSTYHEEIFCDAVAADWYLRHAAEGARLPAAIEEMLLPRNPFKEILVLRARLNAYCAGGVSR